MKLDLNISMKNGIWAEWEMSNGHPLSRYQRGADQSTKINRFLWFRGLLLADWSAQAIGQPPLEGEGGLQLL